MRTKALLFAATYMLIILGVAIILTGCEAAREIGRATYHACRDGLCG